MKTIKSFFVLTFVFTIPAYILIALTGSNIILTPDMVFAFIPLSVIAPIGAALVLTYRKYGGDGVKKLLKRTYDYKRVKNKLWVIPTLFLMPLLFLLVWGVSNALELELFAAPFPFVVAPFHLIMYFISALTEEIGWMGFAFEPMRERWGITKASLMLGLIWGLWHLPMYIFAMPDSLILMAQIISIVAIRFLIVWLFSNTGNSLFIAILFHAAYNVCMSVFPVSFIGNAIIFIIPAIVIIYKWGGLQRAHG